MGGRGGDILPQKLAAEEVSYGNKIESRGEEGRVNMGNGGKQKGITRNNHFTCNSFQLEN